MMCVGPFARTGTRTVNVGQIVLTLRVGTLYTAWPCWWFPRAPFFGSAPGVVSTWYTRTLYVVALAG